MIDDPRHTELLANIKARLPELVQLLEKMNGARGYEDPIYRFYHQSFKVYSLQRKTQEVVDILFGMAPEGSVISPFFSEILAEGSGVKFANSHNEEWARHTRPILEAFFHAKFFLEMSIKYGRELEELPEFLPSGWAALLSLYGIR